MSRSAPIKFIAANAPVRAPHTKFGGQPVWLEKPQWPLSRQFGTPMQFIGQIALDDVPDFSPSETKAPRLAYLFMTDGSEYEHDSRWDWQTYDPEGGENAVVIQPGGRVIVPTLEQATGPAVYKTETHQVVHYGVLPPPRPGELVGTGFVEMISENVPVEYAVHLGSQEEPEFYDQQTGWLGTTGSGVHFPDEDDAVWRRLIMDKLGGTPSFLQRVVYPAGGPWRMVLQLGEFSVPFDVNFGMGKGWLFVAEDGREGRFLWQC